VINPETVVSLPQNILQVPYFTWQVFVNS